MHTINNADCSNIMYRIKLYTLYIIINERSNLFTGIYRIDHLWTLPNLTDLNLSCNNIQFIENINCLPHLTKLNLACNQIKKIENIDQLALLEIFIIHNNQIMEIQNLGNAKELKIFNVKNNKLENFEETVLYLRRFKCLRSLCAIGNPCFETFESDVEG